MPGSHEVIQGGEAGIELDVLEGAGDAQSGYPVGGNFGDVPAIEQDLAFLRAVEAVDAVEQAGLAGAIRADDSQYFAFFYLDVDVGEGLQAAEGKGKIVNAKLVAVSAHHLITPRNITYQINSSNGLI